MKEHKITLRDPYKIDAEEEDPEEEYLLYRNGVGTFRKGDLIGITGEAKSGKTFALSVFAAALLGDTSFGFESKMSDDEKVLFIDTERDVSDVGMVVQRIHMMLGWDINEDNARFGAYYLRGVPREKRYEYVKTIIETVKPAVVFINEIADLIVDYKNLPDIVIRLMQLADEFNCVISCNLHTAYCWEPLYEELARRAFDIYLCSKKGSNSFKISNPISHFEEMKKICFYIKTVNDITIPCSVYKKRWE